ncbi:apolipoprotein N-acyltransferase [soil metagenome]
MSAWPYITGLLLGFSYPPIGIYAFAWLALVPMLVRWYSAPSYAMFFREAYAAFLLSFVVPGYWLVFHDTVAVSGLAMVSILLAPTIPAAVVTLSIRMARDLGKLLGFCFLVLSWLAVEQLLVYGPIGLPWFQLAHTQADAYHFNQFADVFGASGISVWIWLVNGAAATALLASTSERWVKAIRAAGVTVALCLVVGAYSYGVWRVPQLLTTSSTLRVGLVQPALPSYAWAGTSGLDRLQRLVNLSEELREPGTTALTQASAIRESQILVWPEGSLPDQRAPEWDGLYAQLEDWTSRHATPLLTGAVVPSTGESGSDASVAVLFSPSGGVTRIDPVHAPAVSRTVNRAYIGSWSENLYAALNNGRRSAAHLTPPFALADGVVGSLIGFESLYPSRARGLTQQGSQALFSLSNHGAWSNSIGPAQHLALTRLRAIENRRAILVAAADGPSALIYPDGMIVQTTARHQEAAVRYDVPMRTDHTFYMKRGDILAGAAIPLSILMVLGWLAYTFLPWRPPPPMVTPRMRARMRHPVKSTPR